MGTRAELRRHKRSPKVLAAQKPDLRVEVVADEQMVDLNAVEVTVIGKRRLVTRVVPLATRGTCSRIVPVEVDAVVEGEGTVEPVRFVRPLAIHGDRPAGVDATDPAPT